MIAPREMTTGEAEAYRRGLEHGEMRGWSEAYTAGKRIGLAYGYVRATAQAVRIVAAMWGCGDPDDEMDRIMGAIAAMQPEGEGWPIT